MSYKTAWIFCLLILIVPLEGRIVRTSNLEALWEMSDYLGPDDLVAFDVDETLIIERDLFLRPCGKKCVKRMLQMNADHYDEEMHDLLVSRMIQQRKVDLVDEKVTALIRKLQNRGVRVIALTAMRTGPMGEIPCMQEWRFNELQSLGIDFQEAYPEIETVEFSEFSGSRPPHYMKGILCSSRFPKGEVLVAFLEKIEQHPKSVIFIDNSRNNLESMEIELKKAGIDHLGLYYVAATKLKGRIHPKVAEIQIRILVQEHRWVSDGEAREILNASLEAQRIRQSSHLTPLPEQE